MDTLVWGNIVVWFFGGDTFVWGTQFNPCPLTIVNINMVGGHTLTGNMIQNIADLGWAISGTVIGIIVTEMVCFTEYTWQCGLCGKINTTNLLKLLLLWCDHGGHGA